jgi:DNA-binding MarR family transcriptional regulator
MTRWLDDEQQATWRSFLLTTRLLDESLDRQLQRDAGLPHAYYEILVRLSEAPEQRMRMVDLARSLRYSPSRLTHAVSALEREGRVKREACLTDRRGQEAVLTPVGLESLVSAAPGHVDEVRRLIFDRLSTEQTAQLRALCEHLLDGLDPNQS